MITIKKKTMENLYMVVAQTYLCWEQEFFLSFLRFSKINPFFFILRVVFVIKSDETMDIIHEYIRF